MLKLTRHGIWHRLWSADLSKRFSRLIVSIFTFLNQELISILNIFVNRFKSVGLPHVAYIDSLTLIGKVLCAVNSTLLLLKRNPSSSCHTAGKMVTFEDIWIKIPFSFSCHILCYRFIFHFSNSDKRNTLGYVDLR